MYKKESHKHAEREAVVAGWAPRRISSAEVVVVVVRRRRSRRRGQLNLRSKGGSREIALKPSDDRPSGRWCVVLLKWHSRIVRRPGRTRCDSRAQPLTSLEAWRVSLLVSSSSSHHSDGLDRMHGLAPFLA